MKPARMLLFACALIFVVAGAAFLVAPEQFGKVIELSAPTAMARTDVRATYGGLELGIGIFLIICAARSEWIRAGLWALGLATGGFATGRLTGILVEGTASRLMLICLVTEIIVTFLSILLLRRSAGVSAGYAD